jgi:hypothetical protein
VDLINVYQWNQPDPVDPSQCDATGGPTCVNPDPGRSPFYWPEFNDRPDNAFLFGRTCPTPGGSSVFRCARLNPSFDGSPQRSGGWDSYYHSLQLQLNKRFSNGFQAQGAYTWSHSIDTSSKQIRGPGESSQSASSKNWLDKEGERASSNFDVTHNFTLNLTVDLPGSTLTGAAGAILGGWQTGGIVTLASGVPETIQLGILNCRCLSGEQFGQGAGDNAPDLIAGGDNNLVLSDGREPTKYFDVNQFEIGPEGFHGNLGRNTLRAPGIATFDFSLIKNTNLTEQTSLQFRFEAFNIFNRANFGLPNSTLFSGSGSRSGSAGRITSTNTESRELQFALKIIF